jgi:hypothetical protein
MVRIVQPIFRREGWNKMVAGCRPLSCDDGSNDQVLDPWFQITHWSLFRHLAEGMRVLAAVTHAPYAQSLPP